MSDGYGISDADWQALYQRMRKPLFNVALRYLWHASEAEDVVHDAFIALWRKRENVRLPTADAYVWTLLMNRLRNRNRWQKFKSFLPWENVETLLAVDGATEQLQHAQALRNLRIAINVLSDKLKSVLLLTEFSEMSYQQVSEILNIPVGTVGSRRNLALQTLRDVLKED